MNREIRTSCRKIFFKTIKLLIAVMMITTMFPFLIKAETTSKKVQYFVVEKEWENDFLNQRPEKVTVVVTVSDGTEVARKDLTAPDWKASFSLPAYDSGDNKIQYYAYEEATGLDKYQMSNPESNKLTITKSIIVEDNSDRKPVTSYSLNKSGFGNVPDGNVVINQPLFASSNSIISMPDCFSLGNYSVYTKPTVKEESPDTRTRIKYSGALEQGENEIDGSIAMKWADYAEDYLTGDTYDVYLTISDIIIFSPVENDNANVAILANYNGGLHMQAYVTEFDDSNAMKNIVGVKANIAFKVLKKDGSPASGFTQVYITDLDTGDSANNYYDHLAEYEADHSYDFSSTYDNYFGVDKEYAESVTLVSGVASDIYVLPETCLENTTNNDKYAAKKGTPNWDNDPKVSLEFLVSSSSFSYSWSGSDCGTAINTVSPSDIPDKDDFTNTITNISSKYRIEYYYQKESESGVYYSDTPDFPLVPSSTEIMVKPGTEVAVSEEDKTPSSSRGMPETDPDPLKDHPFILDTTMDDDWSGTTSTTVNPLILKVYFKKTYRVTYHDNVEDKVWNAKEKQNNPDLEYNVDTPKFDTTKSSADSQGNPIRLGYTFEGWSEEPESEILSNIPEKVTKDADYWAHWAPRNDTKYTVQWFYEVNGSYPSIPDYSTQRQGTTDTKVRVLDSDLIPQKSDYHLTEKMNVDWEGIVAGDGSLILKIYFKQIPRRSSATYYYIPVTGIE